MLRIIENIPNIPTNPLSFVFEYMKLQHKPDTLWLKFGVATGITINYISKFTQDKVYGFDSFEGSPEKDVFNRNGEFVNNNVELTKGWFHETLLAFSKSHNKKVSFIHIDADLYSSTKYILDTLKDYLDTDCIVVFDKLLNYPGFDGEKGELKAFYEFVTENNVNYTWIGMNGNPIGMLGAEHEKVAVRIHPSPPKICFITAVYGNYESSCKKFAGQTINTDFICFTDNPHIKSNGWTIDTTPYHILNKSELDDDTLINSICNNQHPFNIAKYYKQAFSNIPRMQKYDVVVWLDGTIEIIHTNASDYALVRTYENKILGWHHESRYGLLWQEVNASHFERYTSTFWNNHPQPYQDVDNQYRCYLEDGYDNGFFKNIPSHTPHLGVWVTCFVSFYQKDPKVKQFLDLWYLQTLKYTTQDQIGFPYVCQKTGLIPLTLPNYEVYGDYPHTTTMFYVKHEHGK